jgi:hypothetical protein
MPHPAIPSYIQKSAIQEEYVNPNAWLPYGLTVSEVIRAMQSTYDFLHDVNTFLVSRGYSRFEEMLLGNSFAGLLSEVVVKNLGDASQTLTPNLKVGGFPDLIRLDQYPGNAVLRADEGIEVKSSRQSGGWQGHNPEAGWYLIFRYQIDVETEPVQDRLATHFVQILAAQLGQSDWSFSGRVGQSRRTITASITKEGMHKLRSNPVYQHPGFVVRPEKYSFEALGIAR